MLGAKAIAGAYRKAWQSRIARAATGSNLGADANREAKAANRDGRQLFGGVMRDAGRIGDRGHNSLPVPPSRRELRWACSIAAAAQAPSRFRSGAYLFQLPGVALARDPAFRCRLKATVSSRGT
jgi:hypothetical protein